MPVTKLASKKIPKKQMDLRKSLADREDVMPFHVLGGQVVKELCKRRPVDLATLKSVDGMSDKKVADYGADILEVRLEWWVFSSRRVGSQVAHLI